MFVFPLENAANNWRRDTNERLLASLNNVQYAKQGVF